MILFFDTETTGLPPKHAGLNDPRQPHLVQFAGVLSDDDGRAVHALSAIVRPEGYTIPAVSSRVHGITTEMATERGFSLESVLNWFSACALMCDLMVAHNIEFDLKILRAQYIRGGFQGPPSRSVFDTMKETTDLLRLPGPYGYKWPKLEELHEFLFGEKFAGAHDALEDIRATMRCYFRLMAGQKAGQAIAGFLKGGGS